MIMKDCTGIICKMKTYKELKEQVLEENLMTSTKNAATNFVMGTMSPVAKKGQTPRGSTNMARQGGIMGQGGTVSQVGNFAKANKGMLGAVGAGVVGLGLLTGLIRGRQGNRDNAPQKASTPPPSLSVTQAKEPDIAVGVPATRVSKAVRRIDPSVKPIDNRTTQA